MSNIDIFKPPQTLYESAQILSDHMPVGRAWDNKNNPDKNIYKLVKGLSSVTLSVLDQIYLLSNQFDINQSDDLIDDWEASVEIPDDCIFQFTDLEQRQNRVMQRLRKEPLRTLAELQEYINTFFPDQIINLSAGTGTSTFEYEFEYEFLGGINDKFIIVSDVVIEGSISESGFEYEFEYEFTGGTDTTLLECLLRKVIPANVAILINFVE